MAKRPDKLYIGPMVFSIHYDAAKVKECMRASEDGEDRYGTTRMDRCEVYVDPDRPEQNIRETVIHEALHAAFWVYGIGPIKDAEAEEQIVAPLSSPVMELFVRNPDLVRWMTDANV